MLGESFPEVLAAAQTGAEWAWSRLYRDLSGQVLGYMRFQGAVDGENLLGEVWLQVARNIHSFEGDEGNFRSWVFGIAHNRVIDERRYRSRRPVEPTETVPDQPGESHEVESEAIDSIRRAEIQELLMKLSDSQRDVLILRILGGLTINEIGKAIGKRPGAVKALQRRGLEALMRLSEETGVPLWLEPSVTEVQ